MHIRAEQKLAKTMYKNLAVRKEPMIEKIEIQYFRSIYHETILDAKRLNVFTGKNDVGKSNILKALNLFFNNCIINEGDYSFTENYNIRRLNEVRKETIKGKQFIQIKITFRRGNQYEKTLPEVFTVTKKWNRDNVRPQISDDIEIRIKKKGGVCGARNRASLTRYLNGIKYVYIPAIKDQRIFGETLKQLQNTIYHNRLSENTKLQNSLDFLAETVMDTTQELSDDFEVKTKVRSMITTPGNVDELYRTLNIVTKINGGNVSLENRGDGIRVIYLPAILNYVSVNSSERFIWGFEEPENSLEFNLAIEMAEDFYRTYSVKNTIYLTTHSPVFIGLSDREFCNGYRCYKENEDTKVVEFKKADKLPALEEELGYAKILKAQYEEYKTMKKELAEQTSMIEALNMELLSNQKPVLLTEGKTDAQILNIAWEKLYDYECPFEIKSCNLMREAPNVNALAGVDMLNKRLGSVGYDNTKTVIGLFDNDKAGQKAYKSDENYKEDIEKKWKKHKNGKGYKILIPTTAENEKIAKIGNLSIEYLFSREYINKQVQGKGLRLITPTEVRKINDIDVEVQKNESEEYWYYSKIEDATKTDFAFHVVPTLEVDAFCNFIPLFDLVLEILKDADSIEQITTVPNEIEKSEEEAAAALDLISIWEELGLI